MTDFNIPNSEQADYWSSDSGKKWIEFEDSIDSTLEIVAKILFEKADLKKNQNVLEVGCGTGMTALKAASIIGPNGSIEGADISTVLLEKAVENGRDSEHNNVNFILADAQAHQFENARFDRIISRFGVMFFEDPTAAFANIAKALKPNGRITFVSWAGIDVNPWFKISRDAAVEVLGPVPPPDPTAPGPLAFQDHNRVLKILKDAGLENAKVDIVDVPLVPKGEIHRIAQFVSRAGPAERILKAKNGSASDAKKITSLVISALEEYKTADGLRVPAILNYFTAVRSA